MNKNGLQLVKIISILVVVALAGVLLIQNAFQARIAANDVMAQAILRKVSNALEAHKAQKGTYPTSVKNLTGNEPPYTMNIYFKDTFYGFKFAHNLSAHDYIIMAIPELEAKDSKSYAITTGGHFR